MNYKLRREIDIPMEEFESTTDLLLYNRGIDDFTEYQELTEYNTCDYMNLDNIEDAVKMLIFHMNRLSNIAILVDTDPDGYTSAASLYNYLEDKHKGNLSYIMHGYSKGHGLSGGDVTVGTDINLLIIPDAGTNDFKEYKALNHFGIDVLILDHHEAEHIIQPMQHTVIVNNQTSDNYWNKDLSGVGIVYKFMQAMDDALGIKEADKYLDLVAFGNVSDVMDARSPETKYYIQKGLNNIHNKALKALLDAQSFATKDIINMHTIAWYITSICNGCLRYGKPEERELLFRAFIEDDEEFDYKKRNGDVIKENIYDRAARICINAKSRQDRAKQKSVDIILEKYKNNKDKVLLLDVSDMLDSELTGVSAMKIADTLHRPCILIKNNNKKIDDKVVFEGSGRNFDHSPISSLKDLCNQTGEFILAQGHANAFGVQIFEDNIDNAKQKFNDILKDVEYENEYLVDEIFNYDDDVRVDIDICSEYSDFDDYVGNGLDEPLVILEDVKWYRSDFQIIGNKKDTIRIKNDDDDVTYILFKCNDDNELMKWVRNTWDNNDYVVMNVIGTPCISTYEGVKTAQFVIKDFEIVDGNINDFEDDDEDNLWD